MKPIYLACLLLLAFTLCLAVLGLVLVRRKKVNVRNAATFCRTGTGLVLLAAYALQHDGRLAVPMRALDFWSLMVILAIACYAVLWACVAFQLNRNSQHSFQESEMLSMLHADSHHGGLDGDADTRPERH